MYSMYRSVWDTYTWTVNHELTVNQGKAISLNDCQYTQMTYDSMQ